MLKWQRKYILTVEVKEDDGAITTLEIKNPLTVEFFIDKNVNSQANLLDLKIYNLAEKTRNLLIQDKFNLLDFGSGKRYRKIVLKAGYGINTPIIFIGNLIESYSFRQGTEVITQIYAYDGLYGMVNSYADLTLSKGISKLDAVNKLISTLNKIEKGIITNLEGELKRGALYNENSYLLIKNNYRDYISVNNGVQTITQRNIFVENEKINILNVNDFIDQGYIIEISSDTGLLNTPKRRETFIECDILFDPNIIAGQLIELKSSFNKMFNGVYKVYGFTHNVVISEANGGDAITTLQLYLGTKLLNGLKAIQ